MSLLINVSIIVSNDLPNFKEKIGPIPESDMNIGIVILINETTLNKLKSIQKGVDKLQYLDSREFINNITFFSYLQFNKKICKLSKNSVNNLKVVIENTMRYLPNHLELVYEYETKQISSLTRNKFIKDEVSWRRKNDLNIKEPDEFTDDSNEKIHENRICNVQVKLSKPTVSFIKGLSRRGSVTKKREIKQKELAGEMVVTKITKDNIHIIDIDSNMVYGSGESVSYKPSKITFHTHPDEAYIKNNVHNGWPSSADYCTILKYSFNTDIIIHFVISNEGLYSITFTEEWLKHGKYKKEIDKLIEDHHSMEKQTTKTPAWHVNEVNKIKFNEIKIFNVYFSKWNNIQPILVCFKNQDTNCKILND